MLTDIKVRAAAPREKPYKLYDVEGLYLLVKPTGKKLWRLKYRVAGASGRATGPTTRLSREKVLALGAYPAVSLKNARKLRDDAREQLEAGIDPAEERRAEKIAKRKVAPKETFEAVANEYFDVHSRKLSQSTKVRDRRILKKLVDRLGPRAFTEIETPELLAVLREIETEGRHETAHRALGLASRIYEYAIAAGKATRDASSGLANAIAPVTPKSHAAITDPKQLGVMLCAIDNYSGQPATIAALKLLALLFTRPGELRQARWQEFDLDGGHWVIPAARMKLRREHIVPLPRQAVVLLRHLYSITGAREHNGGERHLPVAILSELNALTGDGDLVFPSLRSGRPLSENTLNLALRNMGYDGDTHVAHGFRSTASTLLHELGFPPEVIETQLAHARPGVGGIYNRSHLLPQRRKMMQDWADYLDVVKAGKTVVQLRRPRKRAGQRLQSELAEQ